MKSMRPDPGIHVQTIRIPRQNGTMPMLILSPREGAQDAPGVLWIHGGGYILGMKEMVHMSQAVGLVVTCGAVIFCPEYRLAWQRPYPAAIEDCYAALLWLRDHAAEYHVRPDQIMVGGESAGGGLCAALCMMARDYGEVPIAYQMPLYPMLDNLDTESSRDNHVYPTDIHAFDMMRPELPISEQATRRFLEEFQYARAHYYTGV